MQRNNNQKTEPNDLFQKASTLGLCVDEFTRLLAQANYAFGVFTKFGPLYGKGEKAKTPPNFRVSAEPVTLEKKYEKDLEFISNVLLKISQALPKLPEKYISLFDDKTVFTTPLSWRLDLILDQSNQLKLLEVQIPDGADALMSVEQIAYKLKTIDQTTPYYLYKAISRMFARYKEIKIIWTVPDPSFNDFSNTLRMKEFIEIVSKKRIKIRFSSSKILENTKKLDNFTAIYSSSRRFSSKYLIDNIGINKKEIIDDTRFNALGSKIIFAFLWDTNLLTFWQNEIGREIFKKFMRFIPGSKIVTSLDELNVSLKSPNHVLKIYASDSSPVLLSRSKGVFGPWNQEEKFEEALVAYKQGSKFIQQDFIKPKSLEILLRSNGGKNLVNSIGYNRICAKFVTQSPNKINTKIDLTAVEATVGKSLLATGRDTCFTAIKFI